MPNILIVYGTSYGQSGKIASAIGQELEKVGHRVSIFESQFAPQSPELQNYDAIIVGASLIAGRYQRSLKNWVKVHSPTLTQKPSAFYSVCMAIRAKEESAKGQVRNTVTDFFKWSNWQPETWTIFAGAACYTKYNWFIKRMMRWISQKAGGDTDMTRDYEYTNWNDVRDFAQKISERLLMPMPHISGMPSSPEKLA